MGPEETGQNSEKVVITVRIDKDLNDILEKVQKKLGISKANLIRNYLKLSKYMLVSKSSLKALDGRELMVLKQGYLKNILKEMEEAEQIRLGEKLGRYINDNARIKGKIDDLLYKLDMCDNLGFFPLDLDNDGFIQITRKFGPRKFVEAFMWQLINQENFPYSESLMASNKKLKGQYNKEVIHPNEPASSYYLFNFAHIEEEE